MSRGLRKYLNPAKYLSRLLVIANHGLLNRLDVALAPSYDQPFRQPPIFILGAPRSGSTLIVQAITDAFDIGYLSNAHCRFFGWPALAERVLRPLVNKPRSSYQSDYGVTKGKHAPSECGEWWYRFFRREPAYVPAKEADPAKMVNFRRSLLALTDAFDKPVIFKNLYVSLRIQAIVKHIPEALFIEVRRNEVDNAVSILEARKKIYGDYHAWFSVPPPNVDALKQLPPTEQVIGQIRSIYHTIRNDLGRVGADRLLVLEYEKFCDDVHGSLEAISSFLKQRGAIVNRLHSVPVSFTRQRETGIPEAMYKDLMKRSTEKG